ncbi:Hypothetical predicted protein [Mytilus galloprovincialis]|uniref:Uncharacterized protein n=1 Tax=Mytilus galloprovincialis TaxID=29158 RepID=A0A8B6DIZ6_MYTGA|nr:Hypothetical predicted protein [Mytilus galloprovincialis]
MKFVILCMSLCVAVMGEQCRQTNDCRVTMCATNANLVCLHGECTCTTTSGATCTTADECRHDCHDRNAHCVDGRCHCRN